MDTRLVYCDETGDDGQNTLSSDSFILTSVYMPSESWNSNFNAMKKLRREWKIKYGFHIKEEFHTKQFLTDKLPYRNYNWSNEIKQAILQEYTIAISKLDIKVINVVIDKTKVKADDYGILTHALTYDIQRIENDSKGDWNYLIISDPGRIGSMRKTARAIRIYNPIHSQFGGVINKPIKYLLEDVLEKDSTESYFIQICDFISYFVHLYYDSVYKKRDLPNRVASLIDRTFILRVLVTFKNGDILNLKASNEKYGLVIYPK